jgi:hypothetical protein
MHRRQRCNVLAWRKMCWINGQVHNWEPRALTVQRMTATELWRNKITSESRSDSTEWHGCTEQLCLELFDQWHLCDSLMNIEKCTFMRRLHDGVGWKICGKSRRIHTSIREQFANDQYFSLVMSILEKRIEALFQHISLSIQSEVFLVNYLTTVNCITNRKLTNSEMGIIQSRD